ncbi:hypothetical protein DM860_010245 [Cuscuta australis]|uniref:Uncharacterized protein n=1 Tax=Cuscuta australis TaxID=267555 RepID=A0A328DAW4_9ASTE|nr:hypothetical protein DM860_010245 [Cuscuta australis]
MDEIIDGEHVRQQPESQSLRMEGPREKKRAQQSASLEDEREGVGVWGDAGSAHVSEESDGGSRRGKDGVGSDDGVVSEGGRGRDEIENGGGEVEVDGGVCGGGEEKGGSEGVEDLREERSFVEGRVAAASGDSLS